MCFPLRDRFRSAYLKTPLLASAPKQPGGWLANPSSRRWASSCPAPLRGVLLPRKGGTSHRLLDAVPLPPVSQHHSTIPTPPKRYDAMARVHASMGSQGLRSTLLGALSLKAWGNPFTADAALMYDTLCLPGKASRAAERKILASEIWQFLMVVLGFFVVALLWLFVLYLPGRTMERGEDQRPGRGDGEIPFPAGSDGPSKPGT
jgi:hypothetical protein